MVLTTSVLNIEFAFFKRRSDKIQRFIAELIVMVEENEMCLVS